jgi:hypothetical protein
LELVHVVMPCILPLYLTRTKLENFVVGVRMKSSSESDRHLLCIMLSVCPPLSTAV